MSRFKTYSQFMSAVGAKMGATTISNQLATWINEAFNESYRRAATFAQWPDLVVWESRIPNTDSYIEYAQNGKDEIEFFWGVYGNSPYSNTGTLSWMNSRLDSTGLFVVYPNPATGESTPNGTTSVVWLCYLPTIPDFYGSNWLASATYAIGDSVYDPITGDYYQAIQAGTNHAVSESTYWKRLQIPKVIFYYLVHSVYASYLLTFKQMDKAALTEEQAVQKFLWPERDRLYKQGYRPVRQIRTYINSQIRRL